MTPFTLSPPNGPHRPLSVRPYSAGRDFALLFLGTDEDVGPIHVNRALTDSFYE